MIEFFKLYWSDLFIVLFVCFIIHQVIFISIHHFLYKFMNIKTKWMDSHIRQIEEDKKMFYQNLAEKIDKYKDK